MNYKNKYLKYKKKYLILKNIVQKGGFSRGVILGTYKKDVSSFKENIESNLAQLLNSYNINYESRDPKEIGMWYKSDYSKLVNNDDDSNQFIGFANDKYWNIKVSTLYGDQLVSYFQSFDYIKPSDALKSFIIGPTFTECANVIQVTIYHHILNLVGEDKFNELFGNLLTPFIITPTLYTPWEIKKRKKNNKKYEPIKENPLYFLCDKIKDISLESLRNNDIVYIKGIKYYNLKHFSGDLIGYNLICIRPSPSDNPKFIGFGPNIFNNGAKTYDEMHKILIDGYNQEQDENTQKIIKNILESSKSTLEMKIKAKLANTLKNDKVTYDKPIDGIIYGLRFSQDKLKRFSERKKQEWYTESDIKLTALLPIEKKIEINLLLDSFSFETKDATFDNYTIMPQLEKIFNYMKLFALKIITKLPNYGPIGIILSGTPGIGKTHLSVSVAKLVSTYGKKVIYVDTDYINSKVTDKGYHDFSSTFNDIDLIILDDINSNFGAGADFLRQALSYVIENNKALLYTSNNIIPVIQTNLPIFFGYDHPFAKNFIAINNINTESYRKPWTDINLGSILNKQKYNLLHNYSGGQGAGIIIETDDMNETKYIEEYNNFTKNTLPIRIIKGYPDKVTDLKKDKIIIISVDEYIKTVELIDILPEIHNNGIKVIVLTKSIKGFKNEITTVLNNSSNLPNKPRLIARLNTIFTKIF
jgi:DNA replication protein DnaC